MLKVSEFVSSVQILSALCGLAGYLFEAAPAIAVFCWVTLIWVPLDAFGLYTYLQLIQPKLVVLIGMVSIWLTTVLVFLWVVLVAYAEYRQLSAKEPLETTTDEDGETRPLQAQSNAP